jgi:hypothetical protein
VHADDEADGALGFFADDTGAFAALVEEATSGIEDDAGRTLAGGATDADEPADFGVAFGLAPAHAAASTRTDRVNLSARRISGP